MRWLVRLLVGLLATLSMVGIAPSPAGAQDDTAEPAPPILEPDPACDRTLDDPEIDPNGTSGSVARLYLAVLDRQPDDAGLAFWVEAIDRGTFTLAQVSDYFVDSPEFIGTYGVTSDAVFVDLVHRNVLCRDADELASAYWLDQLTSEVGRGDVMRFFAESPEFRRASTRTAEG